MTISVGDRLPEASLCRLGENGPETVALSSLVKGRNVALFAVPGAFTPTCHSAHVPSFIRTKEEFAAKGVDEIICVSVNDPFVMKTWGDATGATQAGITMLADPLSEFTKAMGMDFDALAIGFVGRSQRYALYAEDGIVKIFAPEEGKGVCETSAGEALVAQI